MKNKPKKTIWKPCGEGENICNCKNENECGYIEFYAGIEKLNKIMNDESEAPALNKGAIMPHAF